MKIAFVGGGNMAAALIGGLAQAGGGHDIEVLEIDAGRAGDLQARFGVQAHGVAGAWLGSAEIVVLAVKPQQMRAAVDAIRPHLARPLVLSIAAGVRASTLARWLGSDVVVRTMPNTPALIGAGITGAAALPGVSAGQRAAAELILRAVGEVVWFDDESMLDPVTAVSGSGPAYVFFFIEAMQQAAREMGLTEAQSRSLSVQTFLGAARLAAASDEPAAVLRERVTSKGGTTAAALQCFEADRVKAAIVRALHAANARARELGDELDR
ncbi:MAG: pyrroline-5-carboxylate reductase [Burkholderiaceae bacterium]|nr:pyrroline-5-carboxylate reductase [Burkholderiaceae bacterium]